MSEALALVPASNSALARATSGAGFIPSNIPEHLLAPSDEQDDFNGIEPKTPLLAFSGKFGRFFLRCHEEADSGDQEAMGIALARLQTQVMFRPADGNKVERFREMGFDQLLGGENVTICRSSDTRNPAQLNPMLTDAQRAEAKKLGIHGALGKKCMGCPMIRYSTVLDGAPCKRGMSMLWLDGKRGEPLVLTLIAYKSVKAFEDFLAQAFANGKVSIYGYVLQLGREKVTDKSGEYFRLTAKLGQAISAEEKEAYRRLRAELMPMLVRTAEETLEHDEDEPQRYEPAADTGGGRVIDADGEDVGFGAEDVFSGDVPF